MCRPDFCPFTCSTSQSVAIIVEQAIRQYHVYGTVCNIKYQTSGDPGKVRKRTGAETDHDAAVPSG
jgi:hypothetical protein